MSYTEKEIEQIVATQRKFFRTGASTRIAAKQEKGR